jgi:hypothetical protein
MTKDECLKLAIHALVYHQEQTRPIQLTIDTIEVFREALAEGPSLVDQWTQINGGVTGSVSVPSSGVDA